MFSFFKKSKKDATEKKKDLASPSNNVPGKNNSESTSSGESVPNYSHQSRKNANECGSAVTNEKNDVNSANPDLIASTTMFDGSSSSHSPSPKPVERRGSSGVKPCGHGTVAISPRVVVTGERRESAATPPASPVLEVKRQFRISGIQKIEDKQLHEADKLGKILENGEYGKEEKKNLINQEAKFQSQLNDLTKQLSIRDAEANKLKFQMEELQRDVFAKSAGMDRLESELNAAHKECDNIRQRIRHLEEELANYKSRNNQLTEELADKTELLNNYENETKNKIQELEGVITNLREKIETLESQLNELRDEKSRLEDRHKELIAERDEEKKRVAETIEQAIKQKQEIEQKWKVDFEKMRTINIVKEQQLLDDFEWKLREVQQSCRKKLDDKDKDVHEMLQGAYREAEKKMKEAEDIRKKLENLQTYESEVQQLRGKTEDQERAMQKLVDQHNQMKQAEESLVNETKKLKRMIELEKENLQHMQRLHHQEILDKERKLQQRLDEKRTEIAMYWEERLLHECARLKNELEQIHNEEKWMAMESVRKVKDEAFQKAQNEWEEKLRNCLKEVEALKKSLEEKDEHYREQLIKQQTDTDRDIIELRRLMDKIDMSHHDKYEKLVLEHDSELERINQEHESQLKELEEYWQNQVSSLRANLVLVKEQMEKEAQQKVETLIQQHRNELDEQWNNLLDQKSEAIALLEEEYVTKYKTLEEQFYSQQKSHEAREVELLKTVDALKNELQSKEGVIDDLQSNVDTLEGGVQVLNQEIAQQNFEMTKMRREADQRMRGLLDNITKLQEDHEKETETCRLKYLNAQKQSQETIDHLQKKCQCLTKLFEEVRQRYERRDSRQEDLNTISDLRQVIAEQEKDLACLNEEKRFFQMRLMALEKHLEDAASVEDEEFEDAHVQHDETSPQFSQNPGLLSIPPTIPECDDCDE
nr:unnamed protein product [Callosobruchus chinensis]